MRTLVSARLGKQDNDIVEAIQGIKNLRWFARD